ncbi:phosphate/phosphite/phosphonate ABC transporter substrate-binding protein [Pseudahrensia aquimaris]|uniref:Phosphate/phosphite/phosphonate ABC transporter substrate-binding protein n=1 Tax=Pseudahrensia aquimaris TaxID=744461 RepID=A0ABW3FIW1_9HYPH
MSLIASLPMYDWQEQQKATAAFWELLRGQLLAAGFDAPDHLSRPADVLAHWRADNLLFSQTCGYPYITQLQDNVHLLGRPSYAVEGCGQGTYRSAIVARRGGDVGLADFAGKRLAFNGRDSLSGYRCLKPLVDDIEVFFGETRMSGSHRESARMVARGEADCAALDAVCWDMVRRFDRNVAAKLEVVAWAPEFPSLPFICSKRFSSDEAKAMGAILTKVVALAQTEARCKPLRLGTIVDAQNADYAALQNL